MQPGKGPVGGSLRVVGALLTMAAGVLHLAQIGVHLGEGWHVAGFFAATGVAQLGVGLWLLRPRARAWLWMLIVGSATVLALWVISRTTGFPFLQDGPESLGIADAFASLLEALTIAALSLQLLAQEGRLSGPARGLAAVGAVGVAAAWQLAAGAGLFDADEARLALDRPQFLDWLVLALGFGLAAIFVLARPGKLATAIGGLLRGLLASSALLAVVGVVMTLPPTLGQNVDCQYAPLSTVTGTGHHQAPEVAIAPGKTRLLRVFELRACGREAVEVIDAQPLTVDGNGPKIVGFWLLPRGTQVDKTGLAQSPAEALPVPPGGVIPAGEGRQLAVAVNGARTGELRLGSVRITYRTRAGQARFGFATSLVACVGTGCQGPTSE